MELAASGLFRAKWTDQIHEEWIGSILKNRTDLAREKLERTRCLMNGAIMDCLISDYEDLIPSLTLPDDNDKHVLAAAIKGQCDAILTFNLKHFPAGTLSKYDVEVLHPDDFIYHQFGLDEAGVVIAARNCRSRLKSPPKSPEDYLEILRLQPLPKTVSKLLNFAPII